MEENKLKLLWLEVAQNKGALFGLFICLFFMILALFGPYLSPFSPSELTESLRLPPAWLTNGSSFHLLGTDDMGRDTLTRLLHGARLSLFVGFFVVFCCFLLFLLFFVVLG